MKKVNTTKEKITEALSELERGIFASLETYSNVHRGSGHNSMVSTNLFEQARDIVLEYLELQKGKYIVIFCTPRRAEYLIKELNPGTYKIVSSQDIGLVIGIRAIAVNRKTLPSGPPSETGGGTTKLIAKDWVMWANAPDKFEAGTPAIVNVIAFAKALSLVGKFGKDIFLDSMAEKFTTKEIFDQDGLEGYNGQNLLDKFKQTLVGRNITVPTMGGIRSYTNLDNSASTPTFIPIWNVFRQILVQTVNVQKEIVNETKSVCAGFLGAPLTDYEVIFTRNTTEAINLTAESLSHISEDGTESVVLNTELEHSSNDLPWRMIPGCSLIRLSVDDEGFIDLSELENLLCLYNEKGQYGKKRIKLVAVSGASNVLGVCNNIEEISRIVHKHNALLLVDAAQLIAHRMVDMKKSGIDYLAFSAHKVYAPFGCGVLVARKGLLNFNSDEMDLIRSSGEENAAGIAALGKALLILKRIGMDIIQEEEQELTKQVLRGLKQIPGLKIYGMKDPNSPGFSQKLGVVVFELKGLMAHGVAKELAVRSGIGVRSGCLCAHIIIKRILKISPVLEQFQRLIQTLIPKVSFPGLVRVSLDIENNEEDVERLLFSLNKIAQHPKLPKASKAKAKNQMEDFIKDAVLNVFS